MSLKYFFQLDQDVDISLFLTKTIAFCNSRELVGLKPSWCSFNPISFFDFLNFKIKPISFHFNAQLVFEIFWK